MVRQRRSAWRKLAFSEKCPNTDDDQTSDKDGKCPNHLSVKFSFAFQNGGPIFFAKPRKESLSPPV